MQKQRVPGLHTFEKPLVAEAEVEDGSAEVLERTVSIGNK